MAALRCPSPPLSAVAYGSSIAAATTVPASGSYARPWTPAAVSMLSSAKAVSNAPQVLVDLPRGRSIVEQARTPSRGSPTRSLRPPTPSPGPPRSARGLLAERAPTPSRGSPTRSIRPLTPSQGPSRSARAALSSQPSSPPLSRIAAAAVGTPLQRQREAVNARLATPPRSASPSQRSAPSYAPVPAAPEASVPSLLGSQRSPVAGDLRVGSRCKALYEGEWYAGVVVRTPDDNKDEDDPNKRCHWTLQCDIDALGTHTWARQVVEERFFISSQPHAVCALAPPSRVVGEFLPTRATTVGVPITNAISRTRGSVPLQLSNSTKSVSSTAMASSATCPPPLITAALSPRPSPFTSSSLASHLISPRLTQTVLLPRLGGNAELGAASPFAKEQQAYRIVESRAPLTGGASSLPSRRESKPSHRERREPARQSQDGDKEEELNFQKVDEAMEELKAFRFSSQDDPHNQSRDAVIVSRESVSDARETAGFEASSLCGFQRRIEPEATLPAAAPLGTSVQPPSPCSGTDVTVDGTLLASEVSTTVDANGTTRSSEGSVTKLAPAMERVTRVKREVQPDVCLNSGQENAEVGVTKFDGMHLTPLNEKPFQALSSIARQAHSVLIERLTPRGVAD